MTTIAEPVAVPITAPTTGEFKIEHEFTPQGDQPQAIDKIADGIIGDGLKHQTLLGVTGSGKTFTMASIVEKVQRPTLVIAHNKTLGGAAGDGVSDVLPEQLGAVFRFLTTTTTSRRLIFHGRIRISRKRRISTRRSIGCGTLLLGL